MNRILISIIKSFFIFLILFVPSSLVFATPSQIDERPYTFVLLPDT